MQNIAKLIFHLWKYPSNKLSQFSYDYSTRFAELANTLDSSFEAGIKPVLGDPRRTSNACVASVIVLAIISYAIPPIYASFGEVINVSQNDGFSSAPQMVVSENGNIYIVWTDDDPSEIYFSMSNDGGLNFSDPLDISNDGMTSNAPQISAIGDDVYITWFGTPDFSPDVFFSSSHDGGDTFNAPINLSNNTGNSFNPQVAVDGSNVYVVWDDDDPGITSTSLPDIVLRMSNNSGQDFGQIVNISHNDGISNFAKIVLSSNGNIYIAWQDDSFLPGIGQAIAFSSSTDGGGNNFSGPTPLSAVDGYALLSSIKSSGSDNVYISWYDLTANTDVFFVSSNDAGTSFNSAINISNENLSLSDSPQIAIGADGKILIVWRDEIEGSGDIFIANSTDNGLSFGQALNLSDNEFPSSLPQISISDDGSSIYIVWQNDLDLSGNKDIFFSGSLNNGQGFSSPANIAINPQLSESQVTGMLDNTLLVTWADLSRGNSDILFRAVILDRPSITIEEVDDNFQWGTNVTATGIATNSGSDTVTMDWGDGSGSNGILVANNTWTATHIYDSSAVGERTIIAKLINTEGEEDAASAPSIVNVDKRLSSIQLNTIASVIEGEEVSVDGKLVDSETGIGLDAKEITVNGTGSAHISSAITDGAGFFQADGVSPSSTSNLWTVQAHFAGDSAYESSDSVVRSYDTVSPASSQFNVPEGSPVTLELTAFDTKLEFDNVVTAGVVYVSECEEEPSGRFLSLQLCLAISTSAEMAENTSAHVTISFNGSLPSGHMVDEVDVFHQTLGGIIDITESRNPSDQTVTGRTQSFSNFIVGIALHDALPEGSIRKQVYMIGESQTILFFPEITRNVDFDSSSYRVGSTAVLRIHDANANLDNLAIDTLTATISSSSDHVGINIRLSETGLGSGEFTGPVDLTDRPSSDSNNKLHVEVGDRISASYNTQSDAPFEVILDEVSESGMLQLSRYIVTGVNFPVIGNAYELRLIDGSIASSSGITITTSWANVKNFSPYDPSSFILVQRDETLPEPTWVQITTSRDIDLETVTGNTETLSKYAITAASDFPGPGRGGGGLPRPGTGVVLDAVASVISDSGGSSRGNGAGGTRSSVVQQMQPGQESETVRVGSDTIYFNFENVLSGGQLEIESRNISEVEEIFDSVTGNGEQGIVNIDGSEYSTSGSIFEVDASKLEFDGSVQVVVPYDESIVTEESNVRLLHYVEQRGQWEDVTMDVDAESNKVTGLVNTLSPLVVATVDDGTFSDSYFTKNPLDRISAESLNVHSEADEMSMTVSLKNVQRTSQNYTVIFQISDKDGVALFIQSEEGVLSRGGTTEAIYKWKPELTENYKVQVFVWNGLDHPQPLSDMVIKVIKT